MLRSSMGRPSQANARNLVITRSRKILCIATLAVASLGGVAVASLSEVAIAAEGASHQRAAPDLLRARLSQKGQDLVVSMVTANPIPLAELDPSPNLAGEATPPICALSFRRLGKSGERRLCFGGSKPRRRMRLNLLSASGRTIRRVAIAARVLRPSARKLVVSLLPADAGSRARAFGRVRRRARRRRRPAAGGAVWTATSA